ncbi:flagellar capping protein [Clostridium ljungdahlii DSM 13528]|uniref:Flagellar hook-associated protein 2 n=1 Tax=Clostridium ljungdahlii (strain ATCC 55383 / DSM 13528 / PETC) TaxID=748727 RepID=D8GQA6_CLOLD|nr:flagellar filament capping protein FliD [Clostridium ljungdahlii]ADK14029.1 flagellar hook-associated protein [Clostridium ljungdahlii DSM 13528]OAA87520.1 flagellar capping protein [Clostridium ljungdahlii DSM 13528]
MSDSSMPIGSTGAGGGNMIRLTGLSSGLDVDAVVKKMMAGEQTKLDKAQQDQQTTQWKQEAYQDIIKNIKDLQSSFFDSGTSDKNILSQSNFAPFTVSDANGASTVDTSVATFNPMVGAQTGKYSISVTQLAKGAGVTNTLAAGTKLTTKLTDITGTTAEGTEATSLKKVITLTVNTGASDVNITLDNTDGNASVGDLVNAINNQSGGSVKAKFSELTGQFALSSSGTGKSSTLTIKSGTTASLSSIIGFSTDVVSNKGTGTTTNTVTKDGVTTTTTVTEGDWEITSESASNYKVTDAAKVVIQNSQNADVTITVPGGSPVTLNGTNGNAQSTNNFTIDGVSYVLSSEGNASVNIGSDTGKVYDKIKSFIDKYNDIVDDIQKKLTEKPNKDYKPLTDAQKAQMTTSQITAWETKAKAGILWNDDNLETMLNDLSTAFTTAVNNVGLSLGRYGSNNFGIDTSKDYTTPSHIDIVDPEQLKTAIATKGDQISKMFTNISAISNTAEYGSSLTQYKEDGIFTRISKILQKNVGYVNTTFNSAVLTSYANKQYDFTLTGTGGKNTLPDQLYEQQLKIKDIKSKMSTDQEKYYQQFSKLETAMDRLNSQQLQLSSMLGN